MLTFIFELLQQFLFVGFIKTNALKKQLSSDEENELLKKYHNGDKDARNKLIEHNLRLVAHIAKKYENNKDLQEDLISIGTIGLIKGIDHYKMNDKTKLSTFCARCIENEILMHLRNNKKKSLDVSLNEVLGNDKDGGEITLLDIIPYEQKEIIDQIETDHKIKKIYQYFPLLTKREQEILIYRYGLNNTKIKTQKEIAEYFSISRSYVSRIEKRALIKLLKAYLNENKRI